MSHQYSKLKDDQLTTFNAFTKGQDTFAGLVQEEHYQLTVYFKSERSAPLSNRMFNTCVDTVSIDAICFD